MHQNISVHTQNTVNMIIKWITRNNNKTIKILQLDTKRVSNIISFLCDSKGRKWNKGSARISKHVETKKRTSSTYFDNMEWHTSPHGAWWCPQDEGPMYHNIKKWRKHFGKNWWTRADAKRGSLKSSPNLLEDIHVNIM